MLALYGALVLGFALGWILCGLFGRDQTRVPDALHGLRTSWHKDLGGRGA